MPPFISIPLSPAQKRALRARAHHLRPVVSIADKGLSASVMKEIDGALNAHELIKVRVYGDERCVREEILASVCQQLACAAVQHIGKLLVLYRPNPEKEAIKPRTQPTTQPIRPSSKPAAATRHAPGHSAPARPDVATPRARKFVAGSTRIKKSAR